MASLPNKRQKIARDSAHLQQPVFDNFSSTDDPYIDPLALQWAFDAPLVLDEHQHDLSGFAQQLESHQPLYTGTKRTADDAALEEEASECLSVLDQIDYYDPDADADASTPGSLHLSDIVERSPSPVNDKTEMVLVNPYSRGALASAPRYVVSKRRWTVSTVNGQVDGYVKFNFNKFQGSSRERRPMNPRFERSAVTLHRKSVPTIPGIASESVPRSPANLGSAAKMNRTDKQFRQFYQIAYCSGRTLLTTSNAYLDLLSVADANEGIRHCVLALAAGYILDYLPESQAVQSRANHHYSQALQFLDKGLADPSTLQPGNELSVVGALALLISDDTVNFELREDRDRSDPKNPCWKQASRVAKSILDATDPSYQYADVDQAQCIKLRTSVANLVAKVDICSMPVAKLQVEDADNFYKWLMIGSDSCFRKIDGFTGASPMMLHLIAQITQLSALIEKDPDSTILPLMADAIEKDLQSFKQYSEYSEGFDNVEELLQSCVLDQNGLVGDHAAVTDLTAETWSQAAQIYLFCRLHRFPRHHKKVQNSLRVLLQCLQRMPTSGELFTAQSPFFCIFIACLVAYKRDDRQILRNWFDEIVAPGRPRSSVPPIWRIIQEYWTWCDAQPFADPSSDPADTEPLKNRDPWWEKIVDRFLDKEGLIPLI